MPRSLPDITVARAYRLLDGGDNKSAVARKLNITRQTVYNLIKERENREKKMGSRQERIARWNDVMPPPLLHDELSREAARGLEEFGYWRHRYLGRRSTPWQEEAAHSVVKWLESDQTEFAVMNMPPGAGKSTLFTHDLVLWEICRDRTIRILLGHNVSRQASLYVARLRRRLQATRPLPATATSEATKACLAEDYGRFKPPFEEAWRNYEFTVMMSIDEENAEESGLENKEPTVAGYGMESEFLGVRANLAIWDDLITGDILRTKERIEKQRTWWDEEGETRIEPGGLNLLVGQRMGADDLFAYALEQKMGGSKHQRYRHIVFPAHDDEHCLGDHGPIMDMDDDGDWFIATPRPAAKPYPNGCLLDPVRLPWYGAKGLLTLKEGKPSVYEVQYQQRDTAASDVLVPRWWIDGGTDPNTGEHYPGCWDTHRRPADFASIRGLSQPYFSFVSVDPSPSNYWAIIWWIYHPASENLILMDLFNDRMDGSDLLDFNTLDGRHYGILEDWRSRAALQGAPISHIVLEVNVAQKWLLQFQHAQTWSRKHHILFMPHTTGANKLDPEMGVQSVAPLYRFGHIRLPGAAPGPNVVDNLVREATRYEPSRPKAHTDDTLMATWFARVALNKLNRPAALDKPRSARPSWARRKVGV